VLSFKQHITESLHIHPSPDDPHDVAKSNFTYGKVIKNDMMDTDKLIGGISDTDKKEQERVSDLVAKMSDPKTGHISRLIVDTGGNVLEGQHRLSAARQLGHKKVPVTIIKDLSSGFDVSKIEKEISAKGYHPDHVHQITHQILDMIHTSGSPGKALSSYEFPQGHEAAFIAGLNAAIPQ